MFSSRLLGQSPPKLFGREQEINALNAAWESDGNINTIVFVGSSGIGKTFLVANWVAHHLVGNGRLDVERCFGWSFYNHETDQSLQTSSDLFVHTALKYFGDLDPVNSSSWERGKRLVNHIRKNRSLLVLDGLESLLYPVGHPQAGWLKDQGMQALIQGLVWENPGLCVVTSREHIKNIESYARVQESNLYPLLREEAIALLRDLHVIGTEAELSAAWIDTNGHALTLRLLGRFLADAHGGDIRLRSEVQFEKIDSELKCRSSFKVMAAYEKWLQSAGPERHRVLAILRLLGLFNRPISPDCIQAILASPAIPGLTDIILDLNVDQWNIALKHLIELDLISLVDSNNYVFHNPASEILIDTHPLIRKYFAAQLREMQPAYQSAHSRIFDHLSKNAQHQPDSYKGLTPLYQAVQHGCLAGRQQEVLDKVFIDRILRGTGNDTYFGKWKLGTRNADLATMAAFFEQPWISPSTSLIESDRAWLLSIVASDLRDLGRITEAIEPMRAALQHYESMGKTTSVARILCTLSELKNTLGQLPDAIADGRQSITLADRSEELFEKMLSRSTTAYSLFLSGDFIESRVLFAAAEALQRARQQESKLLCAFPGFSYCDLLLAEAERAAWQVILPPSEDLAIRCNVTIPAALADVGHRASMNLELQVSRNWPLFSGLDHLTLARVTLYQALFEDPTLHSVTPNAHVQNAVNGLRQAGQSFLLCQGLLTVAFCYHVIGDSDLAEQSLQEAEQIAVCGPMPLHIADIHLYRARLFHDKSELSKAAKLIHDLDYGRRYQELADAEKSAEGW
jgi:tetratricopeptide (TPR) repeat protein